MKTKKRAVYLKSAVKPASAQHKVTSESAEIITKNTEKDFLAVHEIPPRKRHGKLILEDYDHVNLREYEEGEAEPGDLEWTRYADKNDPQPPEDKIDLNIIPNEAGNLRKTLEDLRQAEIYNFKGKVSLEKKLGKRAVRDLNHALEINPNYVDALINRGKAYVLQNRCNDALKDFNHALEIDKKQARIYNLRGDVYMLNKEHEKAIEDFTSAINLNPMYCDAFLNRARVYTEKGMEKEARSDFLQAIRSEPDKFSSIVDIDELESLLDE